MISQFVVALIARLVVSLLQFCFAYEYGTCSKLECKLEGAWHREVAESRSFRIDFQHVISVCKDKVSLNDLLCRLPKPDRHGERAETGLECDEGKACGVGVIDLSPCHQSSGVSALLHGQSTMFQLENADELTPAFSCGSKSRL